MNESFQLTQARRRLLSSLIFSPYADTMASSIFRKYASFAVSWLLVLHCFGACALICNALINRNQTKSIHIRGLSKTNNNNTAPVARTDEPWTVELDDFYSNDAAADDTFSQQQQSDYDDVFWTDDYNYPSTDDMLPIANPDLSDKHQDSVLFGFEYHDDDDEDGDDAIWSDDADFSDDILALLDDDDQGLDAALVTRRQANRMFHDGKTNEDDDDDDNTNDDNDLTNTAPSSSSNNLLALLASVRLACRPPTDSITATMRNRLLADNNHRDPCILSCDDLCDGAEQATKPHEYCEPVNGLCCRNLCEFPVGCPMYCEP